MCEPAKEYLKKICKRAIDVPGVERAEFDFVDNVYPRSADVRVTTGDGKLIKWWHLNIEELEKLSYPDSAIDNFTQSLESKTGALIT